MSDDSNASDVTMTAEEEKSATKLAERIAILSQIDQDISSLLLAASSTVSALLPSNQSNPASLSERKETLQQSSEEYLRLIGQITRGLRKEVVELEAAQWRGSGGIVGDKVEKGMEAEVWRVARRWVEEWEGEEEGS